VTPRFAIVRARFNDPITAALLDGALRGFADAAGGETRVDISEVPGAFELPLAAKWLAATGDYAAVVCLGCVIRGETPHFDYVAGEAARGIAQVALESGVPVIFGVLTTDSAAQAWARAGKKRRGLKSHASAGPGGGNKGYEAALSAVAMAELKRALGTRTRRPTR
jgi:6,7-dimethyl-8-ribityllumazine synthase